MKLTATDISRIADRLYDKGLAIASDGKKRVGGAAIVDASVATALVIVAKEIRAALQEQKQEGGR